jgi:hypothetical protein
VAFNLLSLWSMKVGSLLLLPVMALAQTTSIPAEPPAPKPITPAQRVEWVIDSTVRPTSVLGNAIGAAIGTGLNTPAQLGTHWSGFERRYVDSMTTAALSNGIEAGLGSVWGEDPRYEVAPPGTSFGHRVLHAAKWTFYARNADGGIRPAYARFIAVPTANAISNSWRPEGDQGFLNFGERAAFGFAGHFGGNCWVEFWPDVKKKIFRRDSSPFHGL